MKTNILLFILVIFVVSLIITLNAFFQNSYQSEMAEQFNRQQLLIARSVAKSLEDQMEHIEVETLSLARLLSDRGLNPRNMEEFINDAFAEIQEEININIKVLDTAGRLLYGTSADTLSPGDRLLFETVKNVQPGKVRFVDQISEERKMVLLTPVARTSAVKGFLIIEMTIDTISKKFLAPIRAGIRGHTWMMDSSGTLLYHPTQPGMVGKNLFKADRSCFECHKSFDAENKILSSGDVGYSTYTAPYGEDKLIAFARAKVPGASWIVCVSIPYSEVTFSIRKSMNLHSLLVISIFIATLTGAFALVLINMQRVKAEEKAKHFETQKQLEKEVVEAKDYLENIIESTESKIMVVDRDMIIRTVNSAHERFCGRTKEEIIGAGFFDVFPVTAEGGRVTLRGVLEKCLEGSSHRLSNFAYMRAGQTLYLNISINPLILHGVIEGIIISSSDVTEEVKLKTKIQEYALRLEEMVVMRTDELKGEKEKLDAIVSAIEGGLCVMDNADKKIIWANRMLLEWMGEERTEGITLSKIYGKDNVQRAIVDDKMLREVIYNDFGRKRGHFQITSTPIIAPDGHPQTLILIQDITDMKKMEERMMQSEKLSALARISAGVAHEIGNPLTSISSYVQILREMEHDEFTEESLETIARHINRIADIVRQMSGFSKTKASDLKHHDLRGLVTMTFDLVKYDKRMKNIMIDVKIPGTLPHVRVDETQMIQVLMNIILNAADAMPVSGSLEITATELDKEVEISIADSGHGIPAEHLERIFDPFFTTKEKGTGLGLAVSYNIIKSYQGDILVTSRPEGGTIFKVRLPIYES